MGLYRGKKKHREAHPKVFVCAHSEKAEIDYFQDFKNYLETPLLMPMKLVCWTPQELIQKVIKWKENARRKETFCEEDGDQIWCVFDVDDFYRDDKEGLLTAVKNAEENGIKIACSNECFELWLLLHFEKPTSAIARGSDLERRIAQSFRKNNLGSFKKNQRVFQALLLFQLGAIQNAKKLLPKYENIDWEKVLNDSGNPSTSLHFLIEEINRLCVSNKNRGFL